MGTAPGGVRLKMHEYLVDTELARLAVVIGVIFGLLVYERLGITMGGVIVPGYLALFLPTPLHIAVTLGLAVLTYYIVHHILVRRYIIYGRSLFESEILVGFLLQACWTLLLLAFDTRITVDLTALLGIGFIMPGIIAHDIGRQGVRLTVFSAVVGCMLVFLLIVFIDLVRDILPLSISVIDSPLLRSQPYPYAYPKEWLLLGIGLSVVGTLGLYHRRELRSGGFVVAAYLALFALRPFDLLFVLLCAGLTYLLVTQLAMRAAIIFGRTKMGLMILVGMVVAWWGETAVLLLTDGRFVPWSGFAVIMPMIVALLANDAERQGPWRTLGGVLLGSGWVLLSVHALLITWRFITPV